MKKICYLFFVFIIIVSCGKNQSSGNKDIKNEISKVSKSKEKVSLKTSDNKNISGNFYFEKKDEKQPIVILIHQFKSNKEQWCENLIDTLVQSGFKVFTYDIRSHGESDKADVPIDNLLTDRTQSPKDLEAVFGWLKMQKGIDSSRVGAAGTSIGGSLSLYTRYYLGAKVAIGISVGNLTFNKLIGIDMRMGRMMPRISNVLFICGTKDGDYAKESQEIYDNFLSDPKEIKLFDSEYHGKDLIKTFPGINEMIVNWFKKYL